MFQSKAVDSPQVGTHERLEEFVNKHITTEYRKPYRGHNIAIVKQLLQRLNENNYQKIILDSCCGTGLSTRTLAAQKTDSLIIGIDQSAHRLGKSDNQSLPDNCVFLRTNCEDFWRLCVENDIQFDEHYLLYPNPYPKSVHFKRRWHAHPVFPFLKSLSRKMVLRSNWLTYLEEFSIAWEILAGAKYHVQKISVDIPLTLFERKYVGSGQTVYALEINT